MLLCWSDSPSLTTVYYRLGGHVTLAFVVRCACGWRVWTLCVCVAVGCIVSTHSYSWLKVSYLVCRVAALYRGDCTLCNAELEEFEYCLVAGSVFLL